MRANKISLETYIFISKTLNLIFEKSKKTVEKTILIIYTINIFNVLSCAGKR
jgi:hypothetical protein